MRSSHSSTDGGDGWQNGAMEDVVRDAYDAVASLYAELFLGDLDRDPGARRWLARFADLAARQDGAVADLGCGPGHVVNHLTEIGLTAIGYDISSGQIAQARTEFPALDFREGDFAVLDVVSEAHGLAFDHKVATAYALFPARIEQQLRSTGFVDIEVGIEPPPAGARPFSQATVLARKAERP